MTSKPSLAILPFTIALLVAKLVLAADTDTRSPDQFFFTQTFGDLPEEMQVARDAGKQGMLLFFEAESCVYCKYMRDNVLNQRVVQDWYAERFVSIAVDVVGDIELKDFDGITLPSKVFAAQRRVFGTPVLSFIDHDGNEIYRYFGMIRTTQQFLLLGEYIEDKHYFDTEYEVFLESRGAGTPGKVLHSPASSEGPL